MQKQSLPRQEPIGLLIAAARRRIKQAVGGRARSYGVSPQQFWVLVALQERADLSLRDLAERQRMDQPTTSRVVAALTRRKLVRIADDPEDRRRSRLRLTAAGRALASDLHALAAEVREALVWGLSTAEKDTLRTLLRRVIANVDRFEGSTPK